MGGKQRSESIQSISAALSLITNHFMISSQYLLVGTAGLAISIIELDWMVCQRIEANINFHSFRKEDLSHETFQLQSSFRGKTIKESWYPKV